MHLGRGTGTKAATCRETEARTERTRLSEELVTRREHSPAGLMADFCLEKEHREAFPGFRAILYVAAPGHRGRGLHPSHRAAARVLHQFTSFYFQSVPD